MFRLNKLNCGREQQLLMLLVFSISLAACNQNTFRRGTPEAAQQPAGEDALPASPPTVVLDEREPEISPRSVVVTRTLAENLIDSEIPGNFRGAFDTKALAPNEANHIWLATRGQGIARHIQIENGQVVSSKTWTNLRTPGAGGTRTYLLEGGGVILAKQGGHLYFLHDGVPEGPVNENPALGLYYRIPNAADNDRACAVSYRRDGRRFVGVGYGQGRFIEFEQANTPPYAPNFAQPGTPRQVHTSTWGYSCFIDQARLIFYGQNLNGNGGVNALNLRNMTTIPLAQSAPNAGFNSNNIPTLTRGVNAVNNGSYAMAGDRMGNILNGTGYYTFAFESRSSTIWGSQGTNLSVFPQNCFVNQPNCNGFATYSLSELIGTGVGPLSALGDGSMVGLARPSGDVYLFRLTDANNPAGGIEAVKIVDDLNNDPYMYTDFTGATLYLNNSRNEFDFSQMDSWNGELPLRQLGLAWSAVQGHSTEWRDIRAEVRCYSDPENRGDFAEVNVVANEKTLQFIDVASCRNQRVSYAELRLTQLNNGATLVGVDRVQLIAFQ